MGQSWGHGQAIEICPIINYFASFDVSLWLLTRFELGKMWQDMGMLWQHKTANLATLVIGKVLWSYVLVT